MQAITARSFTKEEIQSSCRRLDPRRHPMLRQLSRDDIYDHGRGMAPGGLLLADALAKELSLKPGDNVLDLGCGRGQSSVFLASRYQVNVISVDLWIGAEERTRKAVAAGVDARITALQGDVRRGLPVERESVDAIFSMQAFHSFGTQPWVIRYLTSLLKPDGRMAVAQGCFRDEPQTLPPVFTDTDGWNAEYDKYHSPSWWHRHFASVEELDVRLAEELLDGEVMWEDDVLYRCERADWDADYLARSAWLIRHILHGRTAEPSLTHCIVASAKNERPDELKERL